MAVAQNLGPRKNYEYESDDGEIYVITLDGTLGDLTAVDCDEYTTSSTATAQPKGLKPRIVYWESADGVHRKRLTCCKVGATAYESSVSTSFAIDGDNGNTTGRVGEKLTFKKATVAIP